MCDEAHKRLVSKIINNQSHLLFPSFPLLDYIRVLPLQVPLAMLPLKEGLRRGCCLLSAGGRPGTVVRPFNDRITRHDTQASSDRPYDS